MPSLATLRRIGSRFGDDSTANRRTAADYVAARRRVSIFTAFTASDFHRTTLGTPGVDRNGTDHQSSGEHAESIATTNLVQEGGAR
jgi:hypothetical protein